jgi:hypothetical protein
VLDRRGRIAGRLDDDVDLRIRYEGLPVIRQIRTSRLEGLLERDRRILLPLPSDPIEVLTSGVGSDISNTQEMNTRCLGNLREVHRGELPGADQSKAQWLPLGSALLQLCVKVHIFR